jgi:uncharacterized protein YbcI
MVQLLQTYTGRGPTRCRTTIDADLIVCVLADTLTKGEARLAGAGEHAIVLEQRRAYQRLMRDDAIAAVEGLTGRSVIAFVSENHISPDLAIETFVLEPLANGDVLVPDESAAQSVP